MIKLVGESLKQYDLDRQVEIIPVGDVLEVKVLSKSPNALPVCFEEKDGRVYACIPDILLKSSGVITVETLEMLDDGSQIEQRMTFDVSKGKRPDGYVCPKPEILTPNHLKNNGGGGGVSSWNDLTDKPFGETTVMGDTLTWDGNTSGLYNVLGMLYLVSESVPTLEELQQGGTITFNVNGEVITETFTSDGVIDLSSDGMAENLIIVFGEDAVVYIATQDNATLVEEDETTTFEKAGIYFITQDGSFYSAFTINGYTDFEMVEIKTIDPKYLPSGSDSGKFVITMTLEGTAFVIDKTFAEIVQAIESGADVVVKVGSVVIRDYDYRGDFFTFNYMSFNSQTVQIYNVSLSSENSIMIEQYRLTTTYTQIQ